MARHGERSDGGGFADGAAQRSVTPASRFANIVVTDSGTGLVHSAMKGPLARADSLVVVGAPTVDGAGRAATTLDRLASHGHAEQAVRALVVLSCDRWSPEIDRGRIRA
ncbi:MULTISPECIES: hypothetical protein [unclassified Pseudonocardia]|uniref:MinD/ParA family ATP-binding protein n=1 Tax=unclassified Pseudonocardia TaxID=2619320 RepID=UPI00096921C0|nr:MULTISPECIES: hypothetical protein [unclassified Pseudonocardia]MBN9097321.1 hypothetical protein [Pseudonocardia sp.]OJY48879.1 MAG: hypothetical protein BGP03_08825 [Pseudonocardia sp. 73-21]